MNIGSSNRLIYDNCSYQKRLYEGTAPLDYQLYQGKFENCNKCIHDQFWTPLQLVDQETELQGRGRPLSHCDQFKYNPQCKKSDMCTSTFDKTNPIVLAPEVCPIVHNNIKKRTTPGYSLPSGNFCQCDKQK